MLNRAGGGGELITFLTTLRQDPRNLPFDRPCTDTSNWPSSLQCKIGAAWTQRHRWKKHGSALCTVNFKLNFPRSKRKTTTLSTSLSASSPCHVPSVSCFGPCPHAPLSPCPHVPASPKCQTIKVWGVSMSPKCPMLKWSRNPCPSEPTKLQVIPNVQVVQKPMSKWSWRRNNTYIYNNNNNNNNSITIKIMICQYSMLILYYFTYYDYCSYQYCYVGYYFLMLSLLLLPLLLLLWMDGWMDGWTDG